MLFRSELVLALRLLRTNTQSRLHQAWFELLMAARTDRTLHDALVPIWKRRDEATQQFAVALLPETARTGSDGWTARLTFLAWNGLLTFALVRAAS